MIGRDLVHAPRIAPVASEIHLGNAYTPATLKRSVLRRAAVELVDVPAPRHPFGQIGSRCSRSREWGCR